MAHSAVILLAPALSVPPTASSYQIFVNRSFHGRRCQGDPSGTKTFADPTADADPDRIDRFRTIAVGNGDVMGAPASVGRSPLDQREGRASPAAPQNPEAILCDR